MGTISQVAGGGLTINNIQRGTITLATGVVTNTATITAVDTTKAELRFLGNSATTTTNDGAAIVRVELTNSTTVTATRGTNALEAIVSFEVIEYT